MPLSEIQELLDIFGAHPTTVVGYDAWSYFDPAGLDNRILPTELNAASPTYERDLRAYKEFRRVNATFQNVVLACVDDSVRSRLQEERYRLPQMFLKSVKGFIIPNQDVYRAVLLQRWEALVSKNATLANVLRHITDGEVAMRQCIAEDLITSDYGCTNWCWPPFSGLSIL
ncbi:hypothetical protein SEPCBS57363_002864 [Sporothrix epigloea]|uniref:HTH merR-type domain-containing protein n=1 Tax=Sporothrix epigloea TaxID=1892477 RepID=A0ABP0DI77_9PEZI